MEKAFHEYLIGCSALAEKISTLTRSGVISPWIVISPTKSLQSPWLSSITAQLAVGDVSEMWLPPVAVAGSDFLRNSPFWSLPKAEISDTAPCNLCRPSAIFLPTPPPENFVSDLYVAPFSCERNKQRISTMIFVKNFLFPWKGNEIYCPRACSKKFYELRQEWSLLLCFLRRFYFWNANIHNMKCNGRELNEKHDNKLNERMALNKARKTKSENSFCALVQKFYGNCSLRRRQREYCI